MSNKKTAYEFRGQLFKRRFKEGEFPIIDFGCISKANGKGRSKFNDGPVVHIENKNLTLFDLLYQLDLIQPTKKDLESWLKENTSLPESEGIYYINTGLRRAVITTKSIVASVAKVLTELIYATNKSDLFLKRTARSQTLTFKILRLEKSYAAASTFAGLYDTLVPDALLSERTPNYRSYPGYRIGLQLGGNIQTLLIEEYLDQGIRPEGFVSPREVKLWRGKEFHCKTTISEDEFRLKMIQKLEEKTE